MIECNVTIFERKTEMKKALATLLCLLLLGTTALVSCNNDSDNTSSTAGDNSTVVSTSSDTASDSTDTSVDENGWVDGIVGYLGDGKWGRKMPEFKWTDKNTFTVLVYNNEKEATYYSEEIEPNLYETTYDAINDAVDRRNKLIEEKYGITIKARAVADVYSTLSTELQVASDDNCDAAMPFLPACTTLAQDGYLYDLNEFAADGYLDLSMPWWDQNANESFSIADKTYFSISDMSIMQKIVSCCLMFNKDLLKSKYPSLNLYDEVNNKTWTIDKMLQLSKDFTYDSDGVDGLSGNDTWGLIAAYNDSLMLYLSSGSRLVTKNSDDEPVLSLGVDERSINIAQNVLAMLEEKGTWVLHAEYLRGSTDNMWNEVVKIFGEGRALFRSTAFSAVKKVRAYDVNFGLIPYPLLDETQDEYYTPCSARYAYGIVIPYSAPDPDYTAFMLDVISAESKGENASGLTRAYSEVILKGKELDEESSEMLDKYIFSNIVYDLGIIYNFGVDTVISDLMSAGTTDLVSSLDSKKDSIETKIQQVIETYSERS